MSFRNGQVQWSVLTTATLCLTCAAALSPGAELITVAETAPEAVAEDKDSINGVQQLSQEATIINQSFSQQARR